MINKTMNTIVPFPATDFSSAITEILDMFAVDRIYNTVNLVSTIQFCRFPTYYAFPELEQCLSTYNLTIRRVGVSLVDHTYESDLGILYKTLEDLMIISVPNGTARIWNSYLVPNEAAKISELHNSIYYKEDCTLNNTYEDNIAYLVSRDQGVEVICDTSVENLFILIHFNEDISSYFE